MHSRYSNPLAHAFLPCTGAALLGAALLVGCSGSPKGLTNTQPIATSDAGTPDSYAVIEGQAVPVPDIEMGDPTTIDAILNEGKNRNQVMDHLRHLCLEIGPRLTASSALEEANMWAADRFEAWGLQNVETRQWGTATLRFDRGPSYGRVMSFDAESEDQPYTEVRELEFSTLSWAPGTEGPTRGRVVRMPTTIAELNANLGTYKDAWVLHSPYQGGRQGIRGVGRAMAARHLLMAEVRQMIADGAAPEQPAGSQYPDDGVSGIWTGIAKGPAIPGEQTTFLMDVTLADDGSVAGQVGMPDLGVMVPMSGGTFADGILDFVWATPVGDRPMSFPIVDGSTSITTEDPEGAGTYVFEATLDRPEVDQSDVDTYIMYTVLSEEPSGFVSSSRDERVWTTSVKRGQDLLNLTREDVGHDVEVNVRDSDYRWINSDLADGQPVYLEFDLSHGFADGPIPLYNTIAEIPGTERPDEVVIISGHLDSWNGPGSQGTLDNGTGSSVTLETARILAAVGARPKRTIRFVLWTGEEQGLLGSSDYVESLSDEERAKISAVFVDDGGTNYEGGLPAASGMVEYLAAATAPTNGQFFSQIDHDTLMADDNPDNDERAGWLDVNIKDTGETIQTHGGSDHAPFNKVGIPGFFWDEVGRSNYSHGWHTQHDKIDLAIEEYLIQSSTNAAITAYNLACAPDLLPRATQDVAKGD